MLVRVVGISLFCLLIAGRATATPYYVAYEGNAFPETEGWERIFGDENGPQQGGSNRSLVDGLLVLDSMRSPFIYDSYFWHRQLNPDPGELFTCSWQIRVVSNEGPAGDSNLVIARDGRGTLSFWLGLDYVRSSREGWQVPVTPGLFHSYTVESSDMLTYSFFVDGVFAHSGAWDLVSANESSVAFGDGISGGGVLSLAEWDYVRFGVVPEPNTAALVGLVSVRFLLRRSNE